jgi:hypothetical protein
VRLCWGVCGNSEVVVLGVSGIGGMVYTLGDEGSLVGDVWNGCGGGCWCCGCDEDDGFDTD